MHIDKVLIIESSFYRDISDICLLTAKNELEKVGIHTDIVTVPRISEIAHAMNIILETNDYDGVIVLGCFILKKEIGELAMVECVKSVNELAIHYSIPFGFGVITAISTEQAYHIAKKSAIHAVDACIALIKIKSNFHNRANHHLYSMYKN